MVSYVLWTTLKDELYLSHPHHFVFFFFILLFGFVGMDLAVVVVVAVLWVRVVTTVLW